MENSTIRLGIVKSIDAANRRVRVHFPDVNIVSDWLKVVRNTPPNTVTVGGTETQEVYISDWMPNVNDTVLCAYLPGFNSDGFVLGVTS